MTIRINDTDFGRLAKLVYDTCGINLSASKKVLVESRLQKRLITLKLDSFTAYCDYVLSAVGRENELIPLIDLISTNKTDFFRESFHFDFLQKEILPAFVFQNGRNFKVWSSACSTGEEPYTIAMVMDRFKVLGKEFDYRILASDISTKVLEKAITGIYPERLIECVPPELKAQYFLRSKNPQHQVVRIVPRLRSKIQFKRVNLIEDTLDVEPDLDAIFCRNVLIYFDRETQEKVVRKLLAKLRPGGYFFIGHSESVHHMSLPLKQLRPTIFQKV